MLGARPSGIERKRVDAESRCTCRQRLHRFSSILPETIHASLSGSWHPAEFILRQPAELDGVLPNVR